MAQNFVICGITGVGKSFLELELHSKYQFYAWPKYTDRSEQRAEELKAPNIVFLSKEDFEKFRPHFAYLYTFLGNNYGWLRDDLAKNNDKNVVLSITLESLADFMVKVPGFIPVMLHIEPENFGLIEYRIKKREGYDQLHPTQQKLIDEKIQERIIVSRHELDQFPFYQKTVLKYGGQVFSIKDDSTIFSEVIPFILNNREKIRSRSFTDILGKYKRR